MKLTRRWLVPGTVAVAIAAIGTLPHALASTGDPSLPAQTPAQLLAAVKSTDVRAFTGTVRIDAALGLPALPEGMVGNSLGVAGLLTGAHNLRVAADGPDKQRVALLNGLAETDLVHNGTDLWTYDSSNNAVTHRTLRSHDDAATPSPTTSPEPTAGALPTSMADLTPDAAARRLLDKLDPTTETTTDGTTTVAGRDAYVLMLTPRTADTLIGSVHIAVDAANHAPLQVQIVPKGSTNPALTIGFTAVSFDAPSTDTFRFTPPAGATVKEAATPSPDEHSNSSGDHPSTSGAGWSGVLELPSDAMAALGGTEPSGDPTLLHRGPSIAGWLNRIGTATPQGHVVSTRLFSLLLTPDGRMFVGAVPASAVEAAAGAAQ